MFDGPSKVPHLYRQSGSCPGLLQDIDVEDPPRHIRGTFKVSLWLMWLMYVDIHSNGA